MNIEDRQESMIKLCVVNQTVQMLAKALKVSDSTVRSYADYLIYKGRLKNISINENRMVFVAV